MHRLIKERVILAGQRNREALWEERESMTAENVWNNDPNLP